MSGNIDTLRGDSSQRHDSFRSGFLECGICFSTFEDPKFLPCVHTFCRACLANHIRVVCSAANPRFNCPTCRERIEIPNPQAPADQWASQFKSNFLINNLIGMVSSGGVESATLQQTLEGKTCYRHPQSNLDLLCVDHDLMICSLCASTVHRACFQVITLDEAVEEKRENIRRFEHVFCSNLSRAETVVAEQTKERENLRMLYDQEKARIIQHTNAMITKVKENCTRSVEDLDMAFQMYTSELDTVIDDYNGRTTFLKKLKDSTRGMLTGADPMKTIQQYGTLEKYSVKMSSYKESNSSDIQVRSLRFAGNTDPVPFLGEIQTEASTRKILHPAILSAPLTPSAPKEQTAPASPIRVSEGSLLHELCTGERTLVLEKILSSKVKSDKHRPELRDAVSIPGGVLVVTDDQNECVKAFYTHGSKDMHSKLVMEKKPHGLCNYVGNMVAVTVPKAKHIAIISVTPNLILQKAIKTEQRYWGIAAVGPDAFIVSTCPGTGDVLIHIIDQEGSILRCIHSGRNLFANPLYLCTLSTGDIMVSDCTVPELACLRQNGNVMYKYESKSAYSLKKPMGMADDGVGNLLLVDAKATLAVLDYSGRVKKTVQKVEGISEPKGVAIGPKGTISVVNENGKIGIFRLQNCGQTPDSTVPKIVARTSSTSS